MNKRLRKKIGIPKHLTPFKKSGLELDVVCANGHKERMAIALRMAVGEVDIRTPEERQAHATNLAFSAKWNCKECGGTQVEVQILPQ